MGGVNRSRRLSWLMVGVSCAFAVVVTGCGPTEPAVSTSESLDTPGVFEGSPEEYYAAKAACLTAAGYPANASEDGLSVPGVQSSDDAFRNVEAECDAAIGQLQLPELTPEFLTAHFAEQVATAQCLEAEGYDIPDPPALEVYLETYGAEDTWVPYAAIGLPGVVSEGEWDRLIQVCPQP